MCFFLCISVVSFMYFLSIILWPYKNKEINFRRPDMLLHITWKLPFLICLVWSASSNSPPRCVSKIWFRFFFCLDNFYCCSLRYTHTPNPKTTRFSINFLSHTPFWYFIFSCVFPQTNHILRSIEWNYEGKMVQVGVYTSKHQFNWEFYTFLYVNMMNEIWMEETFI